MTTLRKLGLFIKVIFMSIFGTSRGLENIEEELAFIASGKKREENPKTEELKK